MTIILNRNVAPNFLSGHFLYYSKDTYPEDFHPKIIRCTGLTRRVYNPAVIDSANNVKTLGPNATYDFNGNEKYVNSGFILPKGQDKNYPGSSNTFTVTFQNPGIYRYLCIIHPWMTGEKVVR